MGNRTGNYYQIDNELNHIYRNEFYCNRCNKKCNRESLYMDNEDRLRCRTCDRAIYLSCKLCNRQICYIHKDRYICSGYTEQYTY